MVTNVQYEIDRRNKYTTRSRNNKEQFRRQEKGNSTEKSARFTSTCPLNITKSSVEPKEHHAKLHL